MYGLWLWARMSSLKWATVLAITLAACAPDSPGMVQVWPRSAGATTCDEWMQQMTPEQRSGLAKGILNGLVQSTPELAVQTQGDHRSGLLADAITRSCDPALLPRGFPGTGRISEVASMQLYCCGNPIYANCEWDSEPRTCDLRP